MGLHRLHFLTLLSLSSFSTSLPSLSLDPSTYPAASILHRDVAVIGGGSSGTYAAISLHDKNKSVVVIEAQEKLGGHTNTYTDPATGQTYDYGVIEYDNTDIVKKYFARFDIPLTTISNTPSPALKNFYIDFATGQEVVGYTPPNPAAAFATYAAQLAKYPFLNTPGWDLPDPVPADLLIPFGDFVDKYGLADAVFTINSYAQGFGDILKIPSLYILKYFGEAVLAGAQTGFLTTARHDNGELYVRARGVLGDSVLLNSRVLATDRSQKNSIKLVVRTPTGPKLIIAKDLVISIPPLLSNLAGFDLSQEERALFSQFKSGEYYTGILNSTGIPANDDIVNVGASTPYNLPQGPSLYALTPTPLQNLFDIKYGGPADSSGGSPSTRAIESSILSELAKIKPALNLPSTSTTRPEFVAFNSHTPYELRVDAEAIQGGFYRRLGKLQGGKGTYWTGAAFDKHDSADLWAFTEGVLGGMERVGG